MGSCGSGTLSIHFVMRSYRSLIFKVFFCPEILGILDPADLGSYIFVSSWDPGDPGSSLFVFAVVLEILDPKFSFGREILDILDPD